MEEKGKKAFFLVHIYIPHKVYAAAYFATASLIILQFFRGTLPKVIRISRSGVVACSSLPECYATPGFSKDLIAFIPGSS